jgi:diaminopropionate ammonia-lyase
VEPLAADCALEAVQAGRLVDIRGPLHTIMGRLCCGVASLVAWPIMAQGIDMFVAIEDDWARKAMRELARAGIVSGEAGAAGVAGLLALLTDGDKAEHRRLLGLTPDARVVVISTEGATDQEAYREIVGA